MSLHEIVLSETKPETEWVRGRPLAKVSPTFSHGLLQALVAEALGNWAYQGRHGRVATEWRFRVAPPGQIVRPLVPDVAYLAFTAVAADAPSEDVEIPLGAPTVAVEIQSPDDRPADLADKIATYLRAGSALVLVLDPRAQTLAAYDGATRFFRRDEQFEHPVLPGFSLDLEALFARLTPL
jgi:Uma2 family endonuclease